jgi:2-methylcitrate dehydratase PrpD
VDSFPLEEISEFIVSLTPERIPYPVKERVSAQIASVLGATTAGSRSRLFQKILKGTFQYGNPAGPLEQLELLTTASILHDYDDYLFMGHTGHTAVWVPLILGHYLRSSPQEIFTAIVLANELGGRFGSSLLFGPLNGQMWTPIHRFVSAVSSARLLKLSEKETCHALALSLYHPEFPSIHGFMGTDAKARTAAESALFGVKSAFFACEGIQGGKGNLMRSRGFWKNFCYEPLRGTFSGLGESWVTFTLTIKPFPGCAYVDTPILAFRKIRREFLSRFGEELTAPKIERIRLYVQALTAGMDLLSRQEYSDASIHPVTVTFSTPLSLACEILFSEITPEVLEGDHLEKHADPLLEIASRIEIIHDLSLTRKMIENFEKVLPLPDLIRSFSFGEWVHILKSGWDSLRSNLKNAPRLRRRWRGSDLWSLLRPILPHLLGIFLKPLQGFPPIPLDLRHTDFSSFRFLFPARIELFLKDGTILTEECEDPLEDSGGEGLKDLARKKWMREGEKMMETQDVVKICDKIFRLDLSSPDLVSFWNRLLSSPSPLN